MLADSCVVDEIYILYFSGNATIIPNFNERSF